MKKKAILVVSFGTSYEQARKSCIEAVENRIAAENPEFEVRRAFTSRRIVKKLKDRDNLYIDNEKEAMEKLVSEGFEEIYVQPLHIMPGIEYEKIRTQLIRVRHHFDGSIRLGEPLIHNLEDYEYVEKALEKSFLNKPGFDVDRWLFMGHGTRHFANAAYSALQVHFDIKNKPMDIATVEGFPELEDMIPRLKSREAKRWGLAPFMLVAGDHAQNDMAGSEEDSWVNVLKQEGFDVVPCLEGLGSLPEFQERFVQKVSKLVAGKIRG